MLTFVLLSSCIYRSSIEFLYLPCFHWVLVLNWLFSHYIFVFTVLSLSSCIFFFFFFFFLRFWMIKFRFLGERIWRTNFRFLGERFWMIIQNTWRRSLGEVWKTYLGWTNQLKITRYIISRAKTPFRWRNILSIFTNHSCNLMLYFEILKIKQVYLHFK